MPLNDPIKHNLHSSGKLIFVLLQPLIILNNILLLNCIKLFWTDLNIFKLSAKSMQISLFVHAI